MFQVIDLSVTVNETTFVITEPSGYTDPPIRFETWTTIEEQGYGITALHMGTHAGTHCDSSSHYVKDGRTITDIDVSTFVGWAVILDFYSKGQMTDTSLLPFEERIKGKDSAVVVIRNTIADSFTDSGRKLLASWRPKLIITGEGWDIDINYLDSDFFHRADIPMIMRPNHEAMRLVQDNDLIVALPIKLEGREASPVRLIAIRGLKEK